MQKTRRKGRGAYVCQHVSGTFPECCGRALDARWTLERPGRQPGEGPGFSKLLEPSRALPVGARLTMRKDSDGGGVVEDQGSSDPGVVGGGVHREGGGPAPRPPTHTSDLPEATVRKRKQPKKREDRSSERTKLERAAPLATVSFRQTELESLYQAVEALGPKKTLQGIAAAFLPEAAVQVIGILRNPHARDADKLSAARFLAEYGAGLPSKSTAVSSEKVVEGSLVTPDELEAAINGTPDADAGSGGDGSSDAAHHGS